MKALICQAYGPVENLVVGELPATVARAGEVLIEIHACGINYPDALIVQNKYQMKATPPFAPGSEVAGIVKAIGEGVSRVRVGDRVIATMTHGGLAEQVAVDQAVVIKLPPDADLVQAASLLFTYGTAHYTLIHAGAVKAGETVLVLGAAGGVGLACLDVARAMGCRVIAAASSEDKLALCRERGAAATVNYNAEDFKAQLKALGGAKGIDVVVDPVGGAYAEPALRALGIGGRYLVVGFTAGIPSIPLNLALLKECKIIGAFWGAWVARNRETFYRDTEELIAWWREGRINPLVSATYPLEQGVEAIQQLAQRKVKGKVVVTLR